VRHAHGARIDDHIQRSRHLAREAHSASRNGDEFTPRARRVVDAALTRASWTRRPAKLVEDRRAWREIQPARSTNDAWVSPRQQHADERASAEPPSCGSARRDSP
jgi:hypothetical protein